MESIQRYHGNDKPEGKSRFLIPGNQVDIQRIECGFCPLWAHKENFTSTYDKQVLL